MNIMSTDFIIIILTDRMTTVVTPAVEVCQTLRVAVGDNGAQYLVRQRQPVLFQVMIAAHTHLN